MQSRFYETDASDPEAPVVLKEWQGLTPGTKVRYVGLHPLPGPLVVTELIRIGNLVVAVLNDGEYEVDADNLRKEK